MKTLLPRAIHFCQVLSFFSACAFTAHARAAQVECTRPDGQVAPVTMGDETLSCPLQEGRTTFVIKVPSDTPLDHLTFVNENASAAGELKISVSNDQLPAASVKWVEVDGPVAFNHKRLFNFSMVGVDARYVRLAFDVQRVGVILDHSAWKNATDRQLGLVSKKPTQSRSSKTREYDYAGLPAKARVVYVSSGSLSESRPLIDNREDAGFPFAKNDPHPTAIVELAGEEEIHRVAARYKKQTPGRLDVYLLNDMGKSATDLNYQTPIASVADENGDGEASVDFDAQGARYVAVRFTPIETAGGDHAPFEIVEIDAFGGRMPALASAMEAPDLYAVDYTAAPFPGQSTVEISSSLGTLAIPPKIPEVSP